jgi:hypothetical protein
MYLCKEFYQVHNIVVCIGAVHLETTDGQHCTLTTTHGPHNKNILFFIITIQVSARLTVFKNLPLQISWIVPILHRSMES